MPYRRLPSDAPLPTVRTALAARCQVHAVCRACDRIRLLDLDRLANDGYGDVPLIKLSLRCECGSRDCGVAVSGRSVRDG